jgi:hypothetical protein
MEVELALTIPKERNWTSIKIKTPYILLHLEVNTGNNLACSF